MTSFILRSLSNEWVSNVGLRNFSRSSALLRVTTANVQEKKAWIPSVFLSPSVTCQHVFVRHAGHSKWQNIKHTKGAKDAERSLIFSRISLQIRNSLKGGASTNPTANSKLAAALELAKKNNMPKASVDKVISKSQNTNQNAKQAFLEYRGAGGLCLLVELHTDNLRRSRNYVNGVLKKTGFSETRSPRSVLNLFNEKGFLSGTPKDAKEGIRQEVVEEHAIEAGAEEVSIQGDSVEFYTDCKDLHAVLEGLEKFGYLMDECCIAFIPHSPVPIDDSVAEKLRDIIASVEVLEDVEKVYVNAV